MQPHPEQRAPAGIELRPSFRPRPAASHAVFDFDGTLSLVRAGWVEVMLAMFVELAPVPDGKTTGSWRRVLGDDIRRLNGKPTIAQMERFVERVTEHGIAAKTPPWHLEEFRRRLDRVIAERTAAVRAGTMPAERLTVPGTLAMLEALTARGLTLHLASATDERSVRHEAELLGVARFFGAAGERIYAPRGDSDGFSKQAAFERVLAEAGGIGENVLSFGDGPIEIGETKRIGGLAIGVASDESGKHAGKVDLAKRELLVEAGADAVLADYADAAGLVRTLVGETAGAKATG